MARSFEFAIIRFCPDEKRGETVNIGIAVFVDGQIDIRFTDSFAKARALYPNLSFEALSSFPGRINRLLADTRSVAEKHSLLREFGPLTVSELGKFEIFSSDEYELQLQKIFEDFVIPPRAPSKPRLHPNLLRRKVSEMFKSAGLLGAQPEDIEQHKVVQAFPISAEENLFADFAYKNGTYRCAEIIDLKVGEASLNDKFKECCEKAVSLDKAKRKFGVESTRLVLFSAPEGFNPLIDSSLNLLNDYATELLNADSAEDLVAFRAKLAPLPNSLFQH
jgi:hypothetical protein